MNWDDDPGTAEGGPVGAQAKPIASTRLAAPRARRKQQFGLRQLMMLSVYFAVAFASIARALNLGREVDVILAVIGVGLGIVGFGLMLTVRLVRFPAIGWVIAFVGMAAISVVLVGSLTIFTIPLMVGVAIHLTARRRAAEQDALLWVLAIAADRGRPLGPVVAAHAEQVKGVYRLRASRVADCLDHGMPLPDALDFVSSAVPATARVLVRVGHDSGSLAEALRDAAASRSARPPGWQSFGSRVAYLAMVALAIQVVVSFLMYFIIPKFEAIFKDFGIDLPVLTRLAIQISHAMASSWAFPVLLVAELMIPLYLAFAFGGYGNLNVPLLDRFFKRRHSILILRCLAMTVEGGRPITVGLEILAKWYPTAWVRERLAGAFVATVGGLDWIEALRAFGLISKVDAALLESARRAGNLPWALRELAEAGARKLNYRLQVASQVLVTAAVLAIGAVVGLLAVAFFLPLTMLIERLS